MHTDPDRDLARLRPSTRGLRPVEGVLRGLRPPAWLALSLAGITSCRAAPAGELPVRHAPPTPPPVATRSLTIELLALDLTTCGRCTRTESNLDAALATVADRLRRDGVAVEVRKTVVRTAEQAERLRFASSPTIRVDGRDIAIELRESDCGDCGDLCGCAGSVECRVWVWRGREHLEAPEEMIVDAVLRAAREDPPARPAPAPTFRLPDNLRKFFAASATAGGAAPDCCDRATCCPPSAKGACCGTSGACGCKPR